MGFFGTSWWVDPAHDFTVIVLTQRMADGPGMHAAHLEIGAAARAALV
jgi:CubicO group peptidase (beta-lactamase class C family)